MLLIAYFDFTSVPDGLSVRIPGFHPGGAGSTPNLGMIFDILDIMSIIFSMKMLSYTLFSQYGFRV